MGIGECKVVYVEIENVLPVKCLDLRVLDDRVNFRTTFDVALFSISDSEFP